MLSLTRLPLREKGPSLNCAFTRTLSVGAVDALPLRFAPPENSGFSVIMSICVAR